MPGELKQRKKGQKQQNNEMLQTLSANGEDDCKSTKTESSLGAGKARSGADMKTFLCFLSLAACGALTWVVLQQNEKFAQIEEKYKSVLGRTSSLLLMEEKIIKVSNKCESVQQMLGAFEAQRGALQLQLQGYEQDIRQLKEWTSELTAKRLQLQSSVTSLRNAVGQIEERTSAIVKDFTNKVSSVRTDVRRMEGLQSECDSVLSQVGELEEKTAQVERSMVKRIGDVLASSIDRVSNVRSASERNTQAIEQLRRRVSELAATNMQLSEQFRELESGRARLIRTITFAADLKPKVATIKRDFGALEPQLLDLTLRIGQLAEDLGEREKEIAELRQTLSNLTAVEGDVTLTAERLSHMTGMSDT